MNNEHITLSIFNKLSKDEQEEFINNIKRMYIIECMTREEVANKLNISLNLLKYFIHEYNLNKTKEQLKATNERTCMIKYGVKSTNQLESVKRKQSETCMKHYGVTSPLKLSENRNKVANELGYENTFQIPEVKEKIKQQNLEKYGVEYTSQRKEIKEKVANTCLERYGNTCAMSSKPIRDKTRKRYLEEYGVEYPVQRQDVKDKIMQTCLEKHGVPWYCMTPECRNVSGNNSKINQTFANLLIENCFDFTREFVLEKYSFDFKINNILIEINPTYTHNSTIGAVFNNSKSQNKPLFKNYHQEKSKFAKENGFRCIHIFDWDDWNKIINLLIQKNKIGARNCKIKEVSKQECDAFLNNYHLQNTCKSQKVRLGLYYNNELIQIMTFGKPRYNENYEWELLRLCSHKDYIVLGGSQKLWNHFLKNYNPHNVISYCDNSKFSGDVYESLGMKLINYGNPSCNWSKGKQKITNNLLMQRGFDQLFKTNYGKGVSNRELMIQNGWREVYDCGQSTWIIKFN